MREPVVVAASSAAALRGFWEEVNESPAWQDGAFLSLSAAYALVSAVALVRLPNSHSFTYSYSISSPTN